MSTGLGREREFRKVYFSRDLVTDHGPTYNSRRSIRRILVKLQSDFISYNAQKPINQFAMEISYSIYKKIASKLRIFNL